VLGIGAGAAREVGEAVLPAAIRRSQLYRNLVDTTLRFLIENVGGAEGVYAAEALPHNFMVRRAAGNLVELLGIVAFRASPVWVLAAMADVCGIGRELIPEIAAALRAQGLLEPGAPLTSVDELLDGLQRTSSRVAAAINTPPLDLAGLRAEWAAIRNEARTLPPAALPSAEAVTALWKRLKDEAASQHASVFETSSVLAMSAVRALPGGARWLTASTRAGAARAGQLAVAVLLEHYRETLTDMREIGYATYAARQLRPYFNAAVRQFSPAHRTITDRVLDRLR
jgi:hypothetical protein